MTRLVRTEEEIYMNGKCTGTLCFKKKGGGGNAVENDVFMNT